MTMEKIFNLMQSLENIFSMQLNSNVGKYTLFIVCKSREQFALAYELVTGIFPNYDGIRISEEAFWLTWDNGSKISLEKWYEEA